MLKRNSGSFLSESIAELKRVEVPSRVEMMQVGIATMIVIFAMATVLGLMDAVFNYLWSLV